MEATLVRSPQVDLKKMVDLACEVIAPYGPIDTFAARNPWDGMGNKPFEEVARYLQEIRGIDMLPDDSSIQLARNQGKIDLNFLGESILEWLDKESLHIPQDVQQKYCWSRLFNEKQQLSYNKSDLENTVKRFSSLNLNHDDSIVKNHSQWLVNLGDSTVENELNYQMIKWCKLFLDKSQALWSMPFRKEGFYQAWKSLVIHDPTIESSVRKQFKGIPQDAEQALTDALNSLHISQDDVKGYLESHLLALPGWAGMMLWYSQQQSNAKELVMEYLAVRITLESVLVKPYLPLPTMRKEDNLIESLILSWLHWGNMPINEWSQLSSSEQEDRLVLANRFDLIVQRNLWLQAWEKTYEKHLKEKVLSKYKKGYNDRAISAQFVFCIDVRSEPFRRELEKAGPFETFGTAGFFGLPIETCELGSHHTHESLPVMNKPKVRVKETIADSELNQYTVRKEAIGLPSSSFKVLKQDLLSSLMLPEISGPWLTLKTLAQSFMPNYTDNAMRTFKEKGLRKPNVKLTLNHIDNPMKESEELPIGFTKEERVSYVYQALKTMGLTDNFAPLVVICGHGSRSVNNPYASSLDCGACGGASSEFNARVLASLCNLPQVREGLKDLDIQVPNETVFVAAEHITSMDELRWLYVPDLSESAKESFEQIQTILPVVSDEASAERVPKLPKVDMSLSNKNSEAKRRSADWSEVRPEWGLARNAAFIIGKRELTKNCNLDGRVFLQNYNWEQDRNGDILSSIIQGPVTVAQWINLQYYASTVVPHYYGSGNKTTQTITGGIGVMQGNGSDLLTGLPWQSVMQSDTEAYHEPIRLLVMIQSPRSYIVRLLDENPLFYQKVQNEWIRLASLDPNGKWESWS
ncbi:DUF2309 domain-containing protein [Oceanobacillus senegalensis]|uniref:DUF2309 domain-containing protein n=1 Tax=Oceanobacillus senegalensis TaxID=1936063 RepID=UPI001FE3CBF8|nr:putative inorganic carbon transporter subunit DabA [Oceanobacillus senegalensis]